MDARAKDSKCKATRTPPSRLTTQPPLHAIYTKRPWSICLYVCICWRSQLHRSCHRSCCCIITKQVFRHNFYNVSSREDVDGDFGLWVAVWLFGCLAVGLAGWKAGWEAGWNTTIQVTGHRSQVTGHNAQGQKTDHRSQVTGHNTRGQNKHCNL